MAKLKTRALGKARKNTKIPLLIGGKKFQCTNCDCDNFHHVDDNEEFHCNNCNCVYDISDDIYKED